MNPFRLPLALALLSLFPVPPSRASSPALCVVKAGAPGASLLQNGGFEGADAKSSTSWRPYNKGFRIVSGEGRQNSHAAAVESGAGEAGAGAGVCQTLALHRTNVAPLVVRGWSKAENVSGSPDNDYSIYVDLVYADGTQLWGQTANFRCGTHDWEARERVIFPEKPVKSMTVYGLFRGHTGKAWFDDFTVEELAIGGDGILYQGVPMALQPVQMPTAPEKAFKTGDGLRLVTRDNSIATLEVDGRNIAIPGVSSGFLARDVAADSDVYPFEQGGCPNLGLQIRTELQACPNRLVVQGRLSDTTGKDRAVTLLFALPLDAAGWNWGKDIRHSERVQGRGEFSGTVNVRCGATGTMSTYPLGALWDERTGLALGLDMEKPAQYRFGYHAGAKHLLLAYDFGLVKETQRFPSAADFRFVIYRFDPAWGFRAAFQKYMEIFPDHFAVRSTDQGIWMPFTDVSKVQGWQDFGFRYHEGNNNVPWDDEHGVLSFRYTEPMTWWMPMKRDVARTPAEAFRVRDALALGKDGPTRRMAELTRITAMFDGSGEPGLVFRDTPWCNGAVWSLNPNPYLPGELNAATVHWNDSIKGNLYGPTAKGRLDGEYLDSLEGYVTAELNFRREHFQYTTVPLSFAMDTKQPALCKGLAVYEFTKWLADDVHRKNKLMFANSVPYRFTFLAPWLDVMGTETDWLRAGKYRPAAEPTMNLWRTMSGQKPYLLLMNTDYDAFTPDLVEKYFLRCLFYGMFPSMFSHNASENPYWQNPKWYERDRDLFKHYQPLVKRISEAGWQPVTNARCDNPDIFLERFGPDREGTLYFTLLNDRESTQTGWITAPDLENASIAQEMIRGEPVRIEKGRFKAELPSQVAWLIQVRRDRKSGGN